MKCCGKWNEIDFIPCQPAISFLSANNFIPCQPVISFLASHQFHSCQPAISFLWLVVTKVWYVVTGCIINLSYHSLPVVFILGHCDSLSHLCVCVCVTCVTPLSQPVTRASYDSVSHFAIRTQKSFLSLNLSCITDGCLFWINLHNTMCQMNLYFYIYLYLRP